MSYDDVCAIAWNPAREQARKDRTGSWTWHRGKGADEWTSGRKDDGGKRGGKKGSKGSKPDWYGDKDKGGTGNKGKGKSETRHCYGFGEQGHIGVICQYTWTNSIDGENDLGSSWDSELEGENAEELASLETHDEGEWCWPRRNWIP